MDFEKIRFYQLHKQNLLTKADPGEYQKLMIDHIALHSTDYLTPYFSLWARVKEFDPNSAMSLFSCQECDKLIAHSSTICGL